VSTRRRELGVSRQAVLTANAIDGLGHYVGPYKRSGRRDQNAGEGHMEDSAATTLPKSVSSATMISADQPVAIRCTAGARNRAARSAKCSRRSRSSRATSTRCNGNRLGGPAGGATGSDSCPEQIGFDRRDDRRSVPVLDAGDNPGGLA
jgi:hypothetical protein